MTISIENKDLFTVEQGYYLAHCISADFALGAGIAKIFNSKYNMKQQLRCNYEDYSFDGGNALLVGNVFNLVTKNKCYEKPTLESLSNALNVMRVQIEIMGIHNIAMPKIGCGLDRLNWDDVYDLICDTFYDEDVNILICDFN